MIRVSMHINVLVIDTTQPLIFKIIQYIPSRSVHAQFSTD